MNSSSKTPPSSERERQDWTSWLEELAYISGDDTQEKEAFIKSAQIISADAETIRTQTARIAEMEATVEGLRKDAERYRWLKKGCKTKDELLAFVLLRNPDAAIDAALAPPQPTNREDEEAPDWKKGQWVEERAGDYGRER